MRRVFCLPLGFLLVLLSGCAAINPYYDAGKSHHTPSGFRNRYADTVNKPFNDLLRWRWQAWRDDLPRPAGQPTPQQAANLALIAETPTSASPVAPPPRVTWIGHASVLIQAGRLNVLTDPIFSDRASPVQFLGPRRAQPPGLALNELPRIDVVLISHNHYDHLDTGSIQGLIALAAEKQQPQPLFIVPLGQKTLLAGLGATRVSELDWWDRLELEGTQFHFTPAQHWSARGFGDRSQTLWGGFAVFAPGFHWFYSGDTGYSKDFADIRQHFAGLNGPRGFDLALLPVGAYEPRWFMKEQHVNPAEAVQIHRDLGAQRSLGVHWGTFALTDEPLDQPPRDLANARAAAGLAEEEFFLMKIGETRQLPARPAS
ncbi:MAG: MBL fold metallo-hydrolase [Pseudomonadota bacterium]